VPPRAGARFSNPGSAGLHVRRVTYPTAAGWEYVQTDRRTIPEMGVNRVDATLYAPRLLYPEADGGLLPGGTVSITAIVTEPTSGDSSRTLSSATTVVN